MSSEVTTPANSTEADSRRWWGLAVLAGSLLVVVMDMTILNVAIPEIAAELRPTSIELLWIVDIYSLVIAGLLVPFAAIGDRWGRRRMLILGYTLFGIASMLVLVADTSTKVIAVRALLGIGGAAIMPSTLSMIRTLFPNPRERATALGIWGATAAVGAALGPILGGILLEAFTWHSAFLVNVPVMVAAVIGAVIFLPEGKPAHPGPLDLVGAALVLVGMASLLYAIKHLGKDGFTPSGLITLTAALVALTVFVRRSLSQSDPMLDLRLFRGRAFTAGILTAFVTSLALAAVLLLGAQWLQLVSGLSPLHAGLALLPAAVVGITLSPLAPTIASKVGARAVIAGGLAIGGLGFITLSIPDQLTFTWILPALCMVSAATAALAIASAVIMAGAPADRAGNAAALEESAYEVGAAVGVALLGSLGAAIYRGHLPSTVSTLPGPLAREARDSLSGALDVAAQIPGGPALAAAAKQAFTDALTGVGIAGGLLMLAAAAVVFALTPRGLDITESHH